jgi:methylated-DNA-[protein]-cysteine S-methyltransferase
MKETYTVVPSPLGELLLGGIDTRLRRLSFLGAGTNRPPVPLDPCWRRDDDAFSDLRLQLDQYFAGTRRAFDVELDLVGTEWELKVWNALLEIPYAQTRSYGQIAAEPTPATEWH